MRGAAHAVGPAPSGPDARRRRRAGRRRARRRSTSRRAAPATRRSSYPIPTRRRGVLDVGPVHVRRSSLAGMAARASEVGEVVSVRVLPRIVPLTSMAMGHRRALMGGDDSAELGGTDLVGLHEYTIGDDLRRLHWATSRPHRHADGARGRRPGRAARVRRPRRPRRAATATATDDFEEAVELAAALCRVSVERGHPVRFRSLSGRDEIVVPGSASRLPRREARDIDWLLDRDRHRRRRADRRPRPPRPRRAGRRDRSRRRRTRARPSPRGRRGHRGLRRRPQPAVAAGARPGCWCCAARARRDLARLWDSAVAR